MGERKTCENCGTALTGRQRRWCSDSCRKEGHRDGTRAGQSSPGSPDPATSRHQWLAQFDGVEFEPWEAVKLADTADLVVVRTRLQSIPDPSLAVLREIRQHTQAIRQALDSIRWPSDFPALQASEFGRAMARRRWAKRG